MRTLLRYSGGRPTPTRLRPSGAVGRARPGARSVYFGLRPRKLRLGRNDILLRRRTHSHHAPGRPGPPAVPVGPAHRRPGAPDSDCREARPCGPSRFRPSRHGLLGRAGSAAPVMLVLLGLGAHLFAGRRPAGASDPSRPRWHQREVVVTQDCRVQALGGYVIVIIISDHVPGSSGVTS